MRLGDLEASYRLFRVQAAAPSQSFGKSMAQVRVAQIERPPTVAPAGRLHPYAGRQDVDRTVLLPVLYGNVPDLAWDGLMAFHQRTFGGTLEVKTAQRRHGDLSYETLERWVRLGLQDTLQDALDVEAPRQAEVLVVIWSDGQRGKGEGYGGDRHTLVRWVPGRCHLGGAAGARDVPRTARPAARRRL